MVPFYASLWVMTFFDMLYVASMALKESSGVVWPSPVLIGPVHTN
jgi:hypothetical protein